MNMDVSELKREVQRCRSTQAWCPGSIRSQWWPEVEAVVEALEAGREELLPGLVEQAENRAYELAEQAARRVLGDVGGGIRQRVVDELDWAERDGVVIDADDRTLDTVADIIATLNDHEWIPLDMAVEGCRDGWRWGSDGMTLYTSCRLLDDEAYPRWVELRLDDMGDVVEAVRCGGGR